jgi:putative nucleotidyltransferase with HDIG domain
VFGIDRVNKILNNHKFKEYLSLNGTYEANRKFCKHDLDHFLDVARIAYILVLENKIDVSKEVVYAAALLHDIGRWAEYAGEKPHDEASTDLAGEILEESGFNDTEQKLITEAIKGHRAEKDGCADFVSIFYKSDKLARKCYNCEAFDECKWKNEKKNIEINY